MSKEILYTNSINLENRSFEPAKTQEARQAIISEDYISFGQYIERREEARERERQEEDSRASIRETDKYIRRDSSSERPGGTVFD